VKSTRQSVEHEQGHRPLLVVLTGGVASGKTTASDHFSRLGVEVIDTDLVAREVVEPGSEALAEIESEFGRGVIGADGSLDRKHLREIVFRDSSRRKRLESILHPRIEARVRERIAEADGQAYVLLVVPLLVESGLFTDADCIVVVDIPEDEQIRRLIERDKMEPGQARAVLAAQASREQRLDVADEVLDNTGTRASLEQAVEALHQELLARASARVN
jgi:dephospho-CoA kinase